jgi:hypothetical protein
MRTTLSIAAFALTLAPSAAVAQIVVEMTPAKIKEAIAWGESVKRVELPELISGSGFAWKSQKAVWGTYSTPFMRVAAAANAAKKKYKAFSEADVTPDMIAPELHVMGYAVSLGKLNVANVENVVITKKKDKDRSRAIQPTRTEPLSEEYQNLYGAKTEGRSLLAVFPLDVAVDGNEVHIIYDRKVASANGTGGCDDCSAELKLEKLR